MSRQGEDADLPTQDPRAASEDGLELFAMSRYLNEPDTTRLWGADRTMDELHRNPDRNPFQGHPGGRVRDTPPHDPLSDPSEPPISIHPSPLLRPQAHSPQQPIQPIPVRISPHQRVPKVALATSTRATNRSAEEIKRARDLLKLADIRGLDWLFDADPDEAVRVAHRLWDQRTRHIVQQTSLEAESRSTSQPSPEGARREQLPLPSSSSVQNRDASARGGRAEGKQRAASPGAPSGADMRGREQLHEPAYSLPQSFSRPTSAELRQKYASTSYGPVGQAPPSANRPPLPPVDEMYETIQRMRDATLSTQRSEPRIPLPKLELIQRYDGTSDLRKFETFVHDLNRVFANIHGVPQSWYVSQLAGRLDGNALDWFHLENRYGDHWTKVVQDMKDRFIPLTNLKPNLWEEFFAVVQYDVSARKECTVQELLNRLEDLRYRLGPECTDEIMHSCLVKAVSRPIRKALIAVRADTYPALRLAVLEIGKNIADYRAEARQERRSHNPARVAAVEPIDLYAVAPHRPVAQGKHFRAAGGNQQAKGPPPRTVPRPDQHARVKRKHSVFQQCFIDGLCLICFEDDHVCAKCPLKDKPLPAVPAWLVSKIVKRIGKPVEVAAADPDDDDGGGVSGDSSSGEDDVSVELSSDDSLGAYAIALDGYQCDVEVSRAALIVNGSGTPARSPRRPLKLRLRISGHDAVCLVDGGAGESFLSVNFARVHALPVTRFDTPLTVKQAVSGSKASTNYWQQLEVEGADGPDTETFYMVSVDTYDALLCMNWIDRHLAFHNHQVAVWHSGAVTLGVGVNEAEAQNSIRFGKRIAALLGGVSPDVVEVCRLDLPLDKRDSDGYVRAPCLSSAQRQELTALIAEFSDVFNEGAADILPPLRPNMNHSIPFMAGGEEILSRKVVTKAYKMPAAFESQFLDTAAKYLKAGIWQMAKAGVPAATSIMARPKPGDPTKARFVADLRARNRHTIKDVTPPPSQRSIRDGIARDLGNGFVGTELDCPSAFHQQRVVPEDMWKTAMITMLGVIVSAVSQQGDINSGATWGRNMDLSFGVEGRKLGFRWYLDNFWLTTRPEDHVSALRWFFERLRKHKWYVSHSKAVWATDSLDVLGFRVDRSGVHVDRRKAFSIVQHPIPTTLSQLQGFLGLINYVAIHLPDLALIVAPLSAIMNRNDGRFSMSPLCLAAFEKAKQLVDRTIALSPVVPSDPTPVWVVTDASVNGVGGYFGQGSHFTSMKPSAFFSKKFTSAQHNWSTHDQELLAVVALLDAHRDQLLGIPLHVVTDNQSLARLYSKPELKGKSWRWCDFLAEFHIVEFVLVPREKNRVADYFSKLASEYPGAFDTAGDFVFDPCAEDEPTFAVDDPEVHAIEASAEPEDWSEAYASDPALGPVWEHPERYPNLFCVREGRVWKLSAESSELIAVPASKRDEILRSAHSTLAHQGARYTLAYLRKRYWWSTIVKDVALLCESCHTCKVTKSSTQATQGFLQSLTVPTGAWHHVAIDFVRPLPIVRGGHDFVMVVVDRASTMVHLLACRTTLSAAGAADLYLRRIYPLHGWPRSIVSDRDPRFTSDFWKRGMAKLGTDLRMATARHPQTDGQAERAIKSVVQLIRSSLHEQGLPKTSWYDLLPHVEFASNASLSRSTGISPFEYLFGFVPDAIPGATGSAQEDSAGMAERMRVLRDWAHDRMVHARTIQSTLTNRDRRPPHIFAVGDLAYLRDHDADKLGPTFTGPYRVAWADPPNYRLEGVPGHPVFNVDLLKPAAGPVAEERVLPDPVSTQDGVAPRPVRIRRRPARFSPS